MYLMDNESTDYGSHDLQVCMLDHTIVSPHNSLATAHDYDVVMCNNIDSVIIVSWRSIIVI